MILNKNGNLPKFTTFCLKNLVSDRIFKSLSQQNLSCPSPWKVNMSWGLKFLSSGISWARIFVVLLQMLDLYFLIFSKPNTPQAQSCKNYLVCVKNTKFRFFYFIFLSREIGKISCLSARLGAIQALRNHFLAFLWPPFPYVINRNPFDRPLSFWFFFYILNICPHTAILKEDFMRTQ